MDYFRLWPVDRSQWAKTLTAGPGSRWEVGAGPAFYFNCINPDLLERIEPERTVLGKGSATLREQANIGSAHRSQDLHGTGTSLAQKA